MQIVIDIPSELKEALDNAKKETAFNYMRVYNDTFYDAIKNGTPLLKDRRCRMKYRVIINVRYNEAWFEFENAADACNFATIAISNQVSNEDTRKTDHIRIEVVDPTIKVEESKDEESKNENDKGDK